MMDTGNSSSSDIQQGWKSAPTFMRQNEDGEWEFSAEPFQDEFEPGPEGLCRKCANIPWQRIREGDADRPPPTVGKLTGEYADAFFGEARIPTFEKMLRTQEFCTFCRLWLRARIATFPEREIGDGDCSDSDDSDYEYGESYFTYYAGDVRSERSYQAYGRGIDDDEGNWEKRLLNLSKFRLRLRGKHAINNFEVPIELTCLQEELPEHQRTYAGRIISSDCADPHLFSDWLRLCVECHGSVCADKYKPIPPEHAKTGLKLRLINVETLQVVSRDLDQEYCALSYIWGPPPTFRALSSHFIADSERFGELKMDLKPFMPLTSGESPENQRGRCLPRTIRDAIAVTRLLGERYLWVDSICIIQDDSTELGTAISQMDLVYKYSKVTIVAAFGDSNEAGLPRSQPSAPKRQQIVEEVAGMTMIHAQPPLHWVLENSVWKTRMWTFQEDKFSQRQLVFSEHGVYWKCQKETWAEDSTEDKAAPRTTFCEPGTLMTTSGSQKDPTEAEFAAYTCDVRLCTQRKLTNQADALDAFTGVIADMRRGSIPGDWWWGLPQVHFDAALLWKSTDHWYYQYWSSQQGDEGFQKPGIYASYPFDALKRRPQFPSWCWAGWRGPVGYFPRRLIDPELELLGSIESRVAWPWSMSGWLDYKTWSSALHCGELIFRAWVARVDFMTLPGGVRRREQDYVHWRGWPMDTGDVVRDETLYCVLLSRQLTHPIDYHGVMWQHYRRLDAENGCHLVNVMVLEYDVGGTAYRKGIGMMREDNWWSFSPRWQTVRLR